VSNPPLIAIVDDDEAVRSALADLIEVLDMDCRTFDDAESFLQDYEVGRFDCLISDVKMAGISGLDLQAQLRAIDPGLPVIIVTSYGDPDTRTLAMAQGAGAFLTKPVDGSVLADHLASAIGHPSSDCCR
jgi:two-component system response regulator FixJ